MANIANYGLKALVAEERICDEPDCPCKDNQELVRKQTNRLLGPLHQLDSATYQAICLDLDQNPISDRPATSTGEKQRDDGDFDRIAVEAFKEFRNKEREIALNPPQGSCVGDRSVVPGDKFWIGAAHLRHHLELLLVLKGVKPCVLFVKYADSNSPLFSTVIIDCLVPIMDRFDLWSYGFGISVQSREWVFYDARSPQMPLIKKAFLTHPSVKRKDPVAYPEKHYPMICDHDTAQALGYPVPFNGYQSGHFVTIRDNTELRVLAAAGWPDGQVCCVPGMQFTCPTGDESVWKKVVDFHRQCDEVAKSVGTEIMLFTGEHPKLNAWLEQNPDMRDGLTWVKGIPRMVRRDPTVEQMVQDLENMSRDDIQRLLEALVLRHPGQIEDVESSDDKA